VVAEADTGKPASILIVDAVTGADSLDRFAEAGRQAALADTLVITKTDLAPLGPDLIDHLARVSRFNQRADNPTSWELQVHATPEFLPQMLRDRRALRQTTRVALPEVVPKRPIRGPRAGGHPAADH